MSENEYRDMRLAACERWFRQTANPLYVWEALALCNAAPPLPPPAWCLGYLGATAAAITDLSWAVGRGEVEPAAAYRRVPEILGLVRQGKKNSFATMADDADATGVALDGRISRNRAPVELVLGRTRRNLSPERARAIVRRGRKLIGG